MTVALGPGPGGVVFLSVGLALIVCAQAGIRLRLRVSLLDLLSDGARKAVATGLGLLVALLGASLLVSSLWALATQPDAMIGL